MAHHSKEEIVEAHSALETLAAHGYMSAMDREDEDATRKREEAIRKFLPPIPRVTLNDIFWDVNELLFAEVENIRTGELGMLLAYDVRLDGERFIYVNHFDDKISRYSPEMLTLTGEKYNLEKETLND